MAQAVHDDLKTQTRRLCNPQPSANWTPKTVVMSPLVNTPYKVGDILYVREDHYAWGQWEPNGLTPSGRKKWRFRATKHHFSYQKRWMFDHPGWTLANKDRKEGWYKRIGRYMPKEYARTFLEVTEVRVQKVQDISEDDAIAEGVLEFEDGTFKNYSRTPGFRTEDGVECLLARGSFMTLFDSVHTFGTWQSNPWVFVYTFKRIENPANG